MLSMIEEAWGFGGSRVALCGERRESQTKPIAGLPVSWPLTEWKETIQRGRKFVRPENFPVQPLKPLTGDAS